MQQLLSRGSSSWGVAETLVYELHKRVLFPQLPMEWLDVVPPTLHLRPSQEAVWIPRVLIVVGEKGAWEYLNEEKVLDKCKYCFIPTHLRVWE